VSIAETSAPTKRRIGRPTLYRAELCEEAFNLSLLGKTDAEMALVFGVNEDTLNEWKRRHREFSVSITRGKDLADAKMARSLYERGLGYSHEAVKIFMPAGASKPVYADYVEHYPPDTAAASLWLRNRQGAKWKDKTETEHSGTVTLEHLVLQAVSARGAGELIEGEAKEKP
jgi:hypothetical protein